MREGEGKREKGRGGERRREKKKKENTVSLGFSHLKIEESVCGGRGDPFPNLNAVRLQNKLPRKDVESLVLEAFKCRDQILEALSAKPPDCWQREQVVASVFRGHCSYMCTPSTAHTFAR